MSDSTLSFALVGDFILHPDKTLLEHIHSILTWRHFVSRKVSLPHIQWSNLSYSYWQGLVISVKPNGTEVHQFPTICGFAPLTAELFSNHCMRTSKQ